MASNQRGSSLAGRMFGERARVGAGRVATPSLSVRFIDTLFAIPIVFQQRPAVEHHSRCSSPDPEVYACHHSAFLHLCLAASPPSRTFCQRLYDLPRLVVWTANAGERKRAICHILCLKLVGVGFHESALPYRHGLGTTKTRT